MAFSSMLIFTSCKKEIENQPTDLSSTNQTTPDLAQSVYGQYIVIYKSTGTQNQRVDGSRTYEEKISSLRDHTEITFAKYGIKPTSIGRTYASSIQGFVAKLSPSEVEKIKKDPNVESIEEDQIVSLGVSPAMSIAASTQRVPWGVTRVGYGSGIGKTAWIIDTGVDMAHPDITVDAARCKSFLGTNTTAQDQNGHGTHVAGTIAAKDNTVGVIGVASGATVVALRALDAKGSGSISGIVSAVDWASGHAAARDVVNMSLGGGVSSSLDRAVTSAAQKGILFAIASGNSAANAANYSPARVNTSNVYTISAMDSKDTWASFSNFGTPVDFCAPGVSIYSTYLNGYATLSGTSMATPHMAGLLLLNGTNIATSGNVRNDPDGRPDPIAHK